MQENVPDNVDAGRAEDTSEQVDIQNEEAVATDTALEITQNAPTSVTGSRKHRLLTLFHAKKQWFIPLVIILVLVILGGIPFTRYRILGVFIKEQLSVTVLDSTTQAPVTGATVRINGMKVTTNASGQANILVPVGDTAASISKQYYKDTKSNVLVTLSTSQNVLRLNLVATGRQVPVVIINKVNGQPIANAAIKVLDTTAETDKNGKTTIVLPTTAATQQATVSANGYNTLKTSVTVISQAVATNTFAIFPAGKVYFLSNLSGKIDVVATNLDGSDRTTVVAGTGSETADSTALLASRDWKHLALQSKRDTSTQSKIYLIAADTNNLSVIDEGANVSFEFIGWDGDNFVYIVNRQRAINGTYNQTVLKSFNANTGHITTVDQTDAQSGGLNVTFASTIQANLLSDGILYTKFWDRSGYYASSSLLSGKTQVIVKTKPDGSGAQTLKTFNATDYQFIEPQAGTPDEVYYKMGGFDADGTQKSSVYLKYESGNVQPASDVSDSNFYSNTYATYLVSPSGGGTFWSVPTDGKSNLFVGDQSGNNARSVAKLSDYNIYGWYSDAYLLVSKNGSELYILPTSGGDALKISDYYKPSQYFRGYGGGYGGI